VAILGAAGPVAAETPDAIDRVADAMVESVRGKEWAVSYADWHASHPSARCDTARSHTYVLSRSEAWCSECREEGDEIAVESRFHLVEPFEPPQCRLHEVQAHAFSGGSAERRSALHAAVEARLEQRYGAPTTARADWVEHGSALWQSVRVWQRGDRKLYLYLGNPIEPSAGGRDDAVVLRLVTGSLLERPSDPGDSAMSAAERAAQELRDELKERLSSALQAEQPRAAALILAPPDPGAARKQIVRLLEQADAAPGERAALLLLAADWLAAQTWISFDPSDPAPWNPHIPGLTFEETVLDTGGITYRHDLLGKVWREAPEGEWKEFAFAQLQEAGWDTSSCCEAGSDRYRRVIAEGEAYLAAHPESAHRAYLLLQVAQAHETAWTVSRSSQNDPYASASSVGAAAGEAARQRAIALYREIARDFPTREAIASSARKSLPRLELGLTNQQWKYYCICD
jgi:hypothetical protein